MHAERMIAWIVRKIVWLSVKNARLLDLELCKQLMALEEAERRERVEKMEERRKASEVRRGEERA